jgi:N6-adenosine-specific RNA methylase IME4
MALLLPTGPDPLWQFKNRTGKVAPEHKRLSRYSTLSLDDIAALPVNEIAFDLAHLYLWVPTALLPEGLAVMRTWGFTYRTCLVWHKVRRDGGSDGRCMFYYHIVTEPCLFGTKGKNARTLAPGRRRTNLIAKPDEFYPVIESCSPGPRLEMFARGMRPGWTVWGNKADDSYRPKWLDDAA